MYIVQDVARAEETRCDHLMHFELAVSELLNIGCCNCTAKSVYGISVVVDLGTRLFKNTRNDKQPCDFIVSPL